MTKTVKACLLTIADLGEIANLKTEESIAVLDALKRLDDNTLVLCRDKKNFEYKNARKIIPFGRRIPQVLNRIFGRKAYVKLLDKFALKKVNDCNLLVTMPSSFPLTMQKVGDNKGITIAYEGTAHPSYMQKVRKEIDNGERKERMLRGLKVIERSDYIFVLSEFAKETFIENGVPARKVYTTKLGVDTRKYAPGEKTDDVFRVICVGNYGLAKGFQYVLTAWEELKLDNAELVFVGEAESEMKDIVKEYQRKLDNFRAIGFKGNLVPIYQNASILLHPSLGDSWGKVVTEAMSCERAVVVTKETGAKDAITDGKNGFVIPSRDVEEMKKKILYFYNHPDEAKIMGKAGRETVVSNYKWEDFSDRVYAAFEDIIKKEHFE